MMTFTLSPTTATLFPVFPNFVSVLLTSRLGGHVQWSKTTRKWPAQAVRGSNKMARDVQQDCSFWFPGVLYSASLFFLSLCHCEGCSPLRQIQSAPTRSNGGRMTELLWRSVWEGVLLGELTLTWTTQLSTLHISYGCIKKEKNCNLKTGEIKLTMCRKVSGPN